ncbi:CRISPR-associated CARF protein Csa3 [Saccharolobus islandicus]|uniref:CRISPR locus-related DNA-binding protein n=1 Tax=Saccharolobus islandicus (strain L.D.8.5 / Lassen \|nr:CRISPR-associated CARF protein Csa3 [Sulfolobus islandicus]ADB86687.1 CRISPR locus-related DNA-binding protein [Sulfolobus islandicus L.D.8.5]
MVTLVISLGFTVEYLVRVISNRGLKDVDGVVVFSVYGKDEFSKKRSDETLRYAEDYLNKVGVKNYILKYVNVDVPFEEILSQINDVLHPYIEIEFHLIGGMRVLLLSLYYYAMLCNLVKKKVKMTLYTEDFASSYEPPLNLPEIPESREALEIVRLLNREGEMKLSDIAKKLGKSESTISKQLDLLDGLIECRKIQNKKMCKLSPMGKILITMW